MKREVLIGEDSHTVSLVSNPGGRSLIMDKDVAMVLSSTTLGNDLYRFNVGGLSAEATVVSKGEHVFVEVFGRQLTMTVLDPVEQAHTVSEAGDLSTRSPMPGVIVELHVAEGDHVEADQSLVTIESMKLFAILRSAGAGTVGTFNFNVGDTFDKGALLVQIHAPGHDNA